MKTIDVDICPMYDDVVIPKYETEGSAGCDVRAYFSGDTTEAKIIVVKSGETKMIGTGITLAVPNNYVLDVRPRSGMSAKTKVRIANAPGTIDCFSKDSEILTMTGNKNIKDIKINEIVISCNSLMEIEMDKIIAIIDKGMQDVLLIETDTGKLEITENTEVYTSRGVVLAKDLNCEDEIISI